ncbi:MAG: acyl-CoA dehydratase activase [Lachnospiraceae bacterium]|nr:acyl-CoA dehydratase activase [Lachnospiraceae bacterium]
MYYICKYSPIELIRAFGTDMVVPNEEATDLAPADTLIHNNICSHARQFLMASGDTEGVLVTSCCDSLRRVYDTLENESPKRPLYMLDLPHSDASCAVKAYARAIIALKNRFENESSRPFDREAFIAQWKRSAFEWRMKEKSLVGREYVAVMGARGGEGLHKSIWKRMPLPVTDLTCLGCRDLPEPPTDAMEMPEEELLTIYAEALLHQIPCMRMTAIGNRRKLLERPGLRGIIYNTIRFCDYYEFEYVAIRKEVTVPILKIETDYTAQTQGQLGTRLEAFAEQLATKAYQKMEKTKAMSHLYAGIDSGSTTTNVAIIDDNNELKAFSIVRTGAKSAASAEAALTEAAGQLGLRVEDLDHICATGYGRSYIACAHSMKTEITCHARGAHAMNPAARTIIDIGGQDSKVIGLTPEGSVENFVMNDKCAAGTGRFLEMMARTLELDMAEMDRIALQWQKDVTISSTCTVFAESEVIGLIAENTETADIIHGLNKAVAARTVSLAKRVGGSGPYMMTGGVARNPGLVAELEKKLEQPVFVPEHPDLAGALGAAMFAREACEA